jgi:hypothetical protein
MLPVDQQLAGSGNAVLNAFVTNIPYRDDAGGPAACRMRLLQISRIQMMPVDQQLAGSRNAVLMMPGMPFSMRLLQKKKKIPNPMMPVYLPNRQLAVSWEADS